MRKFFASILIASVCVSNSVLAGSAGPISLNGKRLQIISAVNESRVYVYDLPIEDGCTNTTPVLLLDGPDANPIGKELYSALLAAKASGKKVTIQTKGCWSGWSTPVIRSMYLHD